MHYEHKIIDATDLTKEGPTFLKEGKTWGERNWRVVGVLSSPFGNRLVLERER